MEGKVETKIEVELDDDDFLSQVAEAEATFLSDPNFNKRRRIDADAKVVNMEDEKKISEGAYTAALRGSKSIIWQQQNPLRRAINSTQSRPNPLPSAHDFSGSEPSIPEKNCPCGLPCVVFTANTERNQGRKFYKCSVRQENGGCGFFEWCDSASGTGTRNYASNSMFPDFPCPCGAGSCLILTAKTGTNIGQQFYKCPSIQERSCGYFKWCNDNVVATNVFNSNIDFSNKSYSVKTGSFNSSVDFSNKSYSAKTGSSFNSTVDFSNKSYSVKAGSSCFKCGNEGHWAKDCPGTSLAKSTSGDFGARTPSSGSCYKCNKPGHWARNCTSTQYMNP